jgi:hypothetical protein
MSDEFDLALKRELQALADAVPTSAASPASNVHTVERVRPSRVGTHAPGGRPVALSAATVALVAMVVAGVALYGNRYLGQPATSPGASTPSATTTAGNPTPTVLAIRPHVVASFGSDELSSLVRVGGAAFLIDRTDRSIYSIDLATGTRSKALSAGTDLGQTGKFGEPILLGTGAGTVYALDGDAQVWSLTPGQMPLTNAIGFVGLGRLSRVDASDWGANVRAIGTDPRDPTGGGVLYAVLPAHRQVRRYLLGTQLVQLSPDFLTSPRDVSGVDDMFLNGHLYLASAGRVLRFTDGSLDAGWRLSLPNALGDLNPPFFTLLAADNGYPDQGTLYAYDRRNRLVDAFDKAEGSLISQFAVPDASLSLAYVKGMFVTTEAGGNDPTLFWMDAGNLLSASLAPAGAGPSATPVSNCSHPATYSQTLNSGHPVAIEPKLVLSFGSDSLGAAVYGPDGDAYVLDQTDATVYRIDPATGAKKAVAVADERPPGGGTVATPRLLTTGGPDVLILDNENSLWRWRPAPSGFDGTLSRLVVEDSSSWGTNVRRIGTFLTVPDLGLYSLYVVVPAAGQLLEYPAAPDGSGYRAADRKNFLTAPPDLSSVDDLLVESWDSLFLVLDGSFSRCATGSMNLRWRVTLPRDSASQPPFYTNLATDDLIAGQGNLYAYDRANRRLDIFSKSDGGYVGRLVPPDGSTWLSAVGGMFIQRQLDASLTLFWTEGGNLMQAVLPSSASAPN